MISIPSKILNEEDLDAELSRPSPELIAHIRTVASPLLILGAGGKMGPSLAAMAKNAADQSGHPLEVVAISRFSDPAAQEWIERRGVKTIACDLLDRAAVQDLPPSQNLISLVGFKFGTASNPSATWAMNTLVPANIAQHYPHARIVALSTGNVYPMSDTSTPGANENQALTPLGEYANAAIARERIFQFFALRHGTPLCVLRLLYAVELRYGVLSELARAIVSDSPIDVTTGSFNCIWQRDANEIILRSLALASSPPAVYNLCQLESFSVRTVASELGERLGTAPTFHGVEAPTALLADATQIHEALRPAITPLTSVLDWTAHWVKTGGRDLRKPTRYTVRDGVF